MLSLSQPMTRAVFQRDATSHALIPIEGTCISQVTGVEVRYVGPDGNSDWQPVAITQGGRFAGTLLTPAGGWYRIEARASGSGGLLAEATVEKIGVGEVFITSGQSNSANSGDVPMSPKDDRVSAWTGDHWVFAADPQPIATHTGGSPWPSMTDVLIDKLDVPIGLISVGVGGTPIEDWLHTGTYSVMDCYPRLRKALADTGPNGVRAILWHQGESDSQRGESSEMYAKRLRKLIDMSRKDAGWCVPWFIAEVSWVGDEHRANQPAIQRAQHEVSDGETIFRGPTTDNMGDEWRNAEDRIHFNEKGQREHGRRWAVVLLDYLRSVAGPSELIRETTDVA